MEEPSITDTDCRSFGLSCSDIKIYIGQGAMDLMEVEAESQDNIELLSPF